MHCTALLIGLLLLGPAEDPAGDVPRQDEGAPEVRAVAAPGFPFRAGGDVVCAASKIRLKRLLRKQNQVTDTQEWYANNDLARPVGPMDPGWEAAPSETPWGRLAFFRDNGSGLRVGVYVKMGQRVDAKDEKGFSSIYDKEFDYAAVVLDEELKPRKVFQLAAFHPGILEMSHAVLIDDVLYFDSNYNGYASIAREKTGYLSALDLSDGRILWTTKNLVASFWGFLVHGDVVVAGYGFTAEPDYLYLIDRRCGKLLQTIRLKTAHEILIRRGERLYVRCYDHDYVFDFDEKR